MGFTGAQGLFPTVIPAGISGSSATIVGTLSVQTATVGTGADTNETDLITYAVPANTLAKDGQALMVTVWGRFGANANAKTVKIYWGTTTRTIHSGSNQNDNGWMAVFYVTRTSATAQRLFGWGVRHTGNVSSVPATTNSLQDTTTAVTVKVTGTNGTAVANDIQQDGMIVQYIG